MKLENGRLSYEGHNNKTHQWGEINAYGGSLVQSITQAIAGDLLSAAIMRLEKLAIRWCSCPRRDRRRRTRGPRQLEEFEQLMCELPPRPRGCR